MVRIDADRLWASLQTLAQVGGYDDEPTGLRGVNRLALTDADAAGRALVRRWFEEAGLEVRVDRIGNCYGRRAGSEPGLAPVLSGSHIDSVPTGGAFDGALGVMAALEVVRAMNDAGHRSRRPVEIAFFTDEEGARFGTDMLGSAVACGRLALEDALALEDRDGVTVGAELARIGFAGDAEPRWKTPPHAYLEVHVEQGPVLTAEGVDLGVVTGVQAISWRDVLIEGRAAHAGTTPMALRRDAVQAAARIAVEVDRMARSGDYGEDMRATVGFVRPEPGRINIVAARCGLTVDLRNPDEAQMRRAEAELDALFERLRRELRVAIGWEQTARTPPVAFDPGLQALLARHMDAAGLSHRRLLSGAGHDAQEFAAICPTAMVFVPGLHDGISHNPREESTPEACARGVQVLADAVVELAT